MPRPTSIGLELILGTALLAVTGTATAVPADYQFFIDELALSKAFNNTDPLVEFYRDSFDDGTPPPSGGLFSPNTPGTYSMFGASTMGPENVGNNGKLEINSGGAVITPSITGPDVAFQRARLLSNRSPINDPNSGTSGLKSNQVFRVDAVWDLVAPDNDGEHYGIRLEDFFGPITATSGDDVLSLRVVQSANSGNDFVVFQKFNFFTDVIDLLGFAPISAQDLIDYSQIRLSFEKLDTGSNTITASFEYLGGGGTTLLGTADIFDGEQFTRAAIVAGDFQVVPEPTTLALLGLGLAGIGFTRRRKSARTDH